MRAEHRGSAEVFSLSRGPGFSPGVVLCAADAIVPDSLLEVSIREVAVDCRAVNRAD